MLLHALAGGNQEVCISHTMHYFGSKLLKTDASKD